MARWSKSLIAKVVLVSVLVFGSSQVFGVVLPQSPQNPAPYWEINLVGPLYVPGKEYSAAPDVDLEGNPDPGQALGWRGDGTVWDGFDYIEGGNGPGGLPVAQVDSLANCRDLHYKDLVADRISLVVSLEDSADIYYHRPLHKINDGDGATGIWADADDINSTDTPQEVDGLELWGPEGTPDANMYSQSQDPVFGQSKASIMKFYPESNQSTVYVTADLISSILIDDNENHVYLNPELIDLDGLMVWDYEDNGVFDAGDSILFSLAPAGGFDGGEIWVYDFGAPKAQFLNMGGHTWNTGNPVGQIFGLPTENIDALEALPEPTVMILLVSGGLMMLRRKK